MFLGVLLVLTHVAQIDVEPHQVLSAHRQQNLDAVRWDAIASASRVLLRAFETQQSRIIASLITFDFQKWQSVFRLGASQREKLHHRTARRPIELANIVGRQSRSSTEEALNGAEMHGLASLAASPFSVTFS